MSSTKRGGQRSPSDFYSSPPWTVHRFLERVDLPKYNIWYEPCAGDGAIIRAANSCFTVPWFANELREDMRGSLEGVVCKSGLTIGDYLGPVELPHRDDVSVVMTNPPYRIAWEVMHKSLAAFPKSYVVLLLRLNFIASQLRHSFMSRYAPDTYVLPNRPSFKGRGKTDSPEYAWFVWGPAPRARERGIIEVLNTTPRAERCLPEEPTIYPEAV